MILENWVVSASKFKRAVLAVTDHLVTRVNLEPLEDHEGTVGVKAVWEGERGESTLNVNAPSLKGNIKTAGDKAPTVEYWQQGDKRGFALRNPRSISCEFDKETFKKIETGKAGGDCNRCRCRCWIRWLVRCMCFWGGAALVKQEAEPSSPRQLESDPASGDSHDG